MELALLGVQGLLQGDTLGQQAPLEQVACDDLDGRGVDVLEAVAWTGCGQPRLLRRPRRR